MRVPPPLVALQPAAPQKGCPSQSHAAQLKETATAHHLSFDRCPFPRYRCPSVDPPLIPLISNIYPPSEDSNHSVKTHFSVVFSSSAGWEFVTEGEVRIEDKADIVGIVVAGRGATGSPTSMED